MYRVTAACGCNIGKVRRNNEDNFYFDGCFLPQENTGLEIIKGYQGKLGQPICFGVFDGMGGEACGEEAAYLAAKTMWEVNKQQCHCRKPSSIYVWRQIREFAKLHRNTEWVSWDRLRCCWGCGEKLLT